MASILPRYLRYLTIFILIISILYKYEINHSNKTLLMSKKATLQYNRSQVYKIISNIDKYILWYPNVAAVQQIKSHEGEKYRLFTKLPIIGNMSSILTIEKKDRPKQFIYSVNSWLRETNSIELTIDSKNINITHIEWTVYTKHGNLLFQYILFPFAKFQKNQIVREALLTLVLQFRYL